MVRISIYNEKGGVGKTTISYLLASYLSYVKGKSVCVLDFDYPGFHFYEIRREEEQILRDPKSPLSIWIRNNPLGIPPYDILKVPTNTAGVYDPLYVFQFLKSLGGYDYVIMDFPGRFTSDEPIAFIAANGYLDFVAIPTDTDTQARKSALVVADAMRRQGVPCAVFWNRVSNYEAHGNGVRFERGAEPFRRLEVPVLEEFVRENRKFSRNSSEMLFVRSTLCFPIKYINYWSPTLIPFLEALIRLSENPKTEIK